MNTQTLTKSLSDYRISDREVIDLKKVSVINALQECETSPGELTLGHDFEKLSSKIDNCSTEFKIQKCNACNSLFTKVCWTCGSNYCWRCHLHRFQRNYSRLMGKKIYSKRLFHMVVGFKPTRSFNKDLFKEHRKIMAKFVKYVRKSGFKIRGWRVRDVTAVDGLFYFHYHYAVLPENNINKSARLFNELIIKASGGELRVVKSIGYRSKKNLFAYISKRQAGMFGHKDFYGFKDIMTLRQYFDNFHNTRHLVQFGFREALTCNIAPDAILCCPYCQSTNISEVGFIRYDPKYVKPPPELLYPKGKNAEKLENLLALAKSNSETVERVEELFDEGRGALKNADAIQELLSKNPKALVFGCYSKEKQWGELW